MLGKFIHDSYAGEWYNGQLEQTPEYIGNKVSMLIGMPRLRQLRIQEGKFPTSVIAIIIIIIIVIVLVITSLLLLLSLSLSLSLLLLLLLLLLSYLQQNSSS